MIDLEEIKKISQKFKEVVQEHELFEIIPRDDKKIKHLSVDAWSILLSMFELNIQLSCEGNKDKYSCECTLTDRDDIVVSKGFSSCSRNEDFWKNAPSFFILHMAQTRAIAKAAVNRFRGLAELSGFEAITPDEAKSISKSNPTNNSNSKKSNSPNSKKSNSKRKTGPQKFYEKVKAHDLGDDASIQLLIEILKSKFDVDADDKLSEVLTKKQWQKASSLLDDPEFVNNVYFQSRGAEDESEE